VRKLISQYVIVVLVGVLLSGCQSNKLSPKNSADPVRPFLAEGQKAYEAKEWETAITAYRKVLEVDENSLPALYKLGNIAYRQKKLAKARGYYEKVVKVKPRYNKAQYNLAVVNLALAEKHFKFLPLRQRWKPTLLQWLTCSVIFIIFLEALLRLQGIPLH